MTTITHSKRKKRVSPTKRNYFIDIGIALGFLTVFSQDITGDTLHEWLGLALFVGLITHVLLHWKWVINITKRFFSKKLNLKTRLNYIVNGSLLLGFVMMGVSGLAISESVMPLIGMGNGPGFWEGIHEAASSFTLLLVISHVLLHAKWVITNTKKYLLPKKGYAFLQTGTKRILSKVNIT